MSEPMRLPFRMQCRELERMVLDLRARLDAANGEIERLGAAHAKRHDELTNAWAQVDELRRVVNALLTLPDGPDSCIGDRASIIVAAAHEAVRK